MSISYKKQTDGIASSQKYFTQDEILAILSVLSEPEDILLARVGIDLGARVGEMVNLKWADLDFDRKVVTLWDEKKDKTRYCVLTDPTWELLRVHSEWVDKRVEKHVFPFSAKTADRKVKRWAHDAKIARRVRYHMLRHTHVVQSRRAGRDWNWLSQQTGDTVATLISEYGQLSIEDRQRIGNESPIVREGEAR